MVVSGYLENSGVWREHLRVISQLFPSGAWRMCVVAGGRGTSLFAEQDEMQVSLSVEL